MRILVREAHKKGSQQQTTAAGTSGFWLDFADTFVQMCNGAQARVGGHGRGRQQ